MRWDRLAPATASSHQGALRWGDRRQCGRFKLRRGADDGSSGSETELYQTVRLPPCYRLPPSGWSFQLQRIRKGAGCSRHFPCGKFARGHVVFCVFLTPPRPLLQSIINRCLIPALQTTRAHPVRPAQPHRYPLLKQVLLHPFHLPRG